MDNLKYLKQLSIEYPTVSSAASEIINLSSLLYLPKGTEHFISDIHGERDSFLHILKNGSGSVRQKIDDEFGSELDEETKKNLATLIYYPEGKLKIAEVEEKDFNAWCRQMMLYMIRITRRISSKYPRSKFERALEKEYQYIIEELILERSEVPDKEAYYNEIVSSIIYTDRAKEYITVLARLIQHLAIDRLHVIGDAYDRGPNAIAVMDRLMTYHSVDVQWGNHDIIWMGAACGSQVCVAHVVRLCARYGNLSTLEGYGIDLLPLILMAQKTYGDDDVSAYAPAIKNLKEVHLLECINKAISIISWKLEGALAIRRPEFLMESRRNLERIDFDNETVTIEGKKYPLIDPYFPTVDPKDPYKLTDQEQNVLETLVKSFKHSEKLQAHIEFFFKRGSMYRVYNGNLLYHGCIPMNADGSFQTVTIAGKEYAGKSLCDELDRWMRKLRYSSDANEIAYARDLVWFIGTGERSPLYGKDKMATFETTLIEDKDVAKENKNAYYDLYNNETYVKKIFDEFGISWETGHIVNGHVPVKLKDGESPVHCNGKVIIIDGGFSKAYQKVTGIAGYTLVWNSRYLKLVAHEPFVSQEKAIKEGTDIHSSVAIIQHQEKRLCIADTDKGADMKAKIQDLNELIAAYKDGIIREHQI